MTTSQDARSSDSEYTWRRYSSQPSRAPSDRLESRQLVRIASRLGYHLSSGHAWRLREGRYEVALESQVVNDQRFAERIASRLGYSFLSLEGSPREIAPCAAPVGLRSRV